MERREYEIMAAVEDRHFWFLGIRAMVRDAYFAAGLGPDSTVLDVGCATGGMMRVLRGQGRFTGLDASPIAASMARERSGNEVVHGDATAMPFPDASFDGVMALDVLEHIDDDRAAVAEIRRVLKPGGALIATVPCHPILYSRHDRALQHVRRYTRPQFVGLLTVGGFRPERIVWTNSLLFPLAASARLASRLMHGLESRDSDAGVKVGPLNPLFVKLFEAERRISGKVGLPVGLSLLVVAR
jgi:SAM-dependent methyltransferase